MQRLTRQLRAAPSHLCRSLLVRTAVAPCVSSVRSFAAPPASIATRSLHTTASSLHSGPARRFGFPFGLQDVDAQLASYRSCSDVKEAQSHLSDLQSTLQTESHALELESSLLGKAGERGEKAGGRGAVYLDMASRTELWSADVQTLSQELLVEHARKTWVMYPPSVTTSADEPTQPPRADRVDGVRFDIDWSTSRHATRRELAPLSFHARLIATPFQLSNSSAEGAEGDVQSVDLAPMVLVDVFEGSSLESGEGSDLAALEQLRLAVAGADVTKREWAWFVSFMASHPTDLAFDVLSACFLRGSSK